MGKEKKGGPRPRTHHELQRELQRVWISGVLGTLLFALLRTTVLSYSDLSPTWTAIDWNHTASMALRFAYMVWLIAYFFMSSLVHLWDPAPGPRDALFDVFQSLSSFAAAMFLGFIVAISDFPPARDPKNAVMAVNGAILLIGGLSLLLLHGVPGEGGRRTGFDEVDGLRGAIVFLSLSTLVVVRAWPSIGLRWYPWVTLVFMYIVLGRYSVHRVRQAQGRADTAADQPFTPTQMKAIEEVVKRVSPTSKEA